MNQIHTLSRKLKDAFLVKLHDPLWVIGGMLFILLAFVYRETYSPESPLHIGVADASSFLNVVLCGVLSASGFVLWGLMIKRGDNLGGRGIAFVWALLDASFFILYSISVFGGGSEPSRYTLRILFVALQASRVMAYAILIASVKYDVKQ